MSMNFLFFNLLTTTIEATTQPTNVNDMSNIIGFGGIIATVLVGIITCIVTWKLTRLSIKQKKLNFSFRILNILSNSLNMQHNALGDLTITLGDKKLKNPCLLLIEIENTGNEAIHNPPICIRVDNKTEIIPGYIQNIPAGYESKWSLKKTSDNSCNILLEHINSKQTVKKGYFLYNGKYTTQDDESDCDLVIKSSNRICFIEVKKTNIEDEFNKLDDVAALQQLSKGMVKAQKQAFRHKKNLFKNRTLTLKNKQNEVELSCLGNEHIYLFSICLPEYSFLTSKSFSSKLLEVILLGGFSTVDPNRQCEVEELNKLGKTMLQYAEEINNKSPVDVHSLSFYSVFASAQQLLTALWCSNNQEEFVEIIKNWIYGTDGSLNLYRSILFDIAERNRPKSIRKSAIDMLENTKKEAVFVGWDG